MKLFDIRVNKSDISSNINNFSQVIVLLYKSYFVWLILWFFIFCIIKDIAEILIYFQTQVPITCIAQHPSQKHFIFTGSEEGDIGVWDMRTNSLLTTMNSGDTSPLTELAFHPLEPDHLFSCSYGGRLLQWSSKKSYLCRIDPGMLIYDCSGKW